MTMEVPPFQRPKPTLQHFPRGVQNPCGNQVQDWGYWWNGRGQSARHLRASRVSSPWCSMLAMEMGCLHPSWNTDQGVKQTRKGEDIVASTSLVLKGRCECIHGVHTQMPNTDRPSVGWVRVCLFGPERWWTMPEQGEAGGNPGGGL